MRPVSAPSKPSSSRRGFARVLAAEGVSNFGSMLSRLAIPWIATLLLGVSPLQMGGLLVAEVLAGAVGSLWLGGWVDRRPKRVVMLLCDALRAAVLLLMLVMVALHALGFATLLLLAAASGCLTMAFELARSAWMAQSVAVEQLPRRNSQLAMTGSMSEAAAFALGGWIFQAWGAALALAVDALSYLLSALCLRGVAESPPVDAETRHGRRHFGFDAIVGLRAVASRPLLRALAGIEVLRALTLSITGTSYMIFVARDIGFGTGAIGTIAATGGLGALAGAAVAPLLGRRLGRGWAMVLGLALFAAGALCLPLLAASGAAGITLLVAHQITGDAGHTLHDVHDRTLRQTAVPPALLARADAGLRTVAQVATLAGALGGGALANALGARSALLSAAALAALASVLAALTLTRHSSA